jgi:hypothetical protein
VPLNEGPEIQYISVFHAAALRCDAKELRLKSSLQQPILPLSQRQFDLNNIRFFASPFT